MNKNYDFLPHEYNHLSYLKEHAYECTLFLKYDGVSFPLKKACSIYLIGNGVRHTVIGGTGSGAVNVKYNETIEEAFINAGFNIKSKEWLDEYDKINIINQKEFVELIKKEAKEKHTDAPTYSVGKIMLEKEYDIPLEKSGNVAIYILSRTSGEGSDRTLRKGDIYLTDTEIKTILHLNKYFKRFLLVLNVPGVIDLSPVVDEVKNILLLSQLGSLTGDILSDIVLGKKNPCGKLSTTWAKIEDYPYISAPIDDDECLYKEGIYVGYRYFTSKGIKPLFPFGYGLSYSKFAYQLSGFYYQDDKINVKVKVTNKGPLKGKETIELYLKGKKEGPYQELVSYNKTQILEVNKSEELHIEFLLSEFASYDVSLHSYIIYEGDYVLSIGTSSLELSDVLNIHIEEDIVIKEVKNLFGDTEFKDLELEMPKLSINKPLPTISLNNKNFKKITTNYDTKPEFKANSFVSHLSINEQILLSLGDYKTGIQGIIGQSCSTVVGGAGETTLRVDGLNEFLNMVDGPAGLRIAREYILNSKGTHIASEDSIWKEISKYLPSFIDNFLSYKRNLKKKGSRVSQITTAIPIATALAQSFNPGFIYGCGRLIKEEMELYDVDILLAPASNIHRSILCGRNFEYYSEDPFLSATCASNIINGIQNKSHKIATIKHFALNNQENNRLNNNSIASERAIREIYLRTFEKIIKWSQPKALMASYNLVNGEHTASSHHLLIDVLRKEWGYHGLVMTDWVYSGQTYKKNNKYPSSYASKCLKNGVNICMPGSKKDIKDIKKAIKSGYLSKEELLLNASFVYEFIKENKGI